MTEPLDIVNMALSEIGSQTVEDVLNDTSPAGVQSALYYARMRQQVLRTAPWGFARRTVTLEEIGTLEAGTSPYPWLFKYTYPTDCQKFRYILPPPTPPGVGDVPDVSDGLALPWCGPSREWRFLVGYEAAVDEEPAYRFLISNVQDALGVYTADVEDPDVWDSLFTNALVMALASKFVMPLTGNANMKANYVALANEAIAQARVVDGNEAIPTTDHITDWIAIRGIPPMGPSFGGMGYGWGQWLGTFDTFWGM